MSTRDERWPQGTPSWVDLTSPDVPASVEFYQALFGWDVIDSGPETGHYRMCLLHNREVGGIGPAQSPGAPPVWTTYLAVDDADKTCEAITSNGGTVVVPTMAVPEQGRLAVAQDPTGAFFGIWQADPMIGMSIFNEPGAVVWNEQISHDPDRAREFYAAVFGYTYHRMEGDQPYWTVARQGGDVVGGIGAMWPGVPPEAPAHWMTYFMVDSVDDTAATAQGAGGTVSVPAFDTPFGRMAVLTDPQGAVFSVMSAPADQAAQG